MAKSVIKRIILYGAYVLIFVVILAGVLWRCSEEQRFVMWFDQDTCANLFDCTPEEFVAGNYIAREELKNLIIEARVNDKGWLVIEYTKRQEAKWKNSEFLNAFPEISDVPEIELSDDRSTITVFINPEKPIDTQTVNIVNKLLAKLSLWRTFSGVPDGENYTTVIKKNHKTGEIIATDIVKMNPLC